MTVYEYYSDISSRNARIVNESLEYSESNNVHATAHAFLTDLNNWMQVLQERPESSLYDEAFKEYHYSLIFATQGFYRQAFNSLRFFIEHTHAALYFSSKEIELRLWMLGQQDIYWSNIVDEEQGFFSKKFFQAFAPFLIDEIPFYRSMAKKLYRECSEFIHGNYSTYSLLPSKLEYNEAVLKNFYEKADTARLLITFSLCVRFIDKLKESDKRILEDTIMEHIGFIKSIHLCYELPEGVSING